MALIYVNRARALVHDKALDSTGDSTNTIQLAFDRIADFDAEKWASESNLSETASAALAPKIGELIRTAVHLFALQTLPRCSTAARHGEVRTLVLDELLASIEHLYLKLRSPYFLLWPLLVAGVAAARGTEAQRCFVKTRILVDVRKASNNMAPILCMEKLSALWASGKTEWEDFFPEPFIY